ncbi:transmembrane protein, putative (macronuclear) [Tetrahymena thermophila SB210]|uniref:Transmembrane protein, putative n=1 Tax=Tetrahymena thermophila (strain SB210) TaxID=312017 RepID=Q234N6_TETTS|nr:transmembrane protein, putative [Tetrahymena thermophila SB210]EAR91967.3 transmembrane protein, putative [Tetrahymena thermophila SB210]|eukprot:XP_001012212.3 transmembrane protein, putative [Tetrahymena thermophila SB210]
MIKYLVFDQNQIKHEKTLKFDDFSIVLSTTDIKDQQSFIGIKFIINNSLIQEDFNIEKQNVLDLIHKSTQDLSSTHELSQSEDEKLLLNFEQMINCIKNKTKCQFFDPLKVLQNKSLINKFIHFGEDFTLNNSQDRIPKQMNSVVHHFFSMQKDIKSQKSRKLLQCEGCNDCTTFVIQTVCNEECILGYFPNEVFFGKQCKKCHQSCLGCDKEGPNGCTSCDQDSQLYQNKCCRIKNGEFYNQQTKKCEQCPQNCQICIEPNNCKQCMVNYELNSLNQCLCLYGQYFDDNTKSCLDCDKSCKTCKQTSKSCTSCQDFQFLNTQSLTCQNSCDQAGYYALEKNCLPCDSACLTCSGSSKNCTSCKFGQLLNIQSQTCIDECPTNGFYIEKKKCIPCDSSCSTCSGSSKCTTCAKNFYQYGGDNLCKPCNNTSLNPDIITYQIAPYNAELKTISLQIDPLKLIQNRDYTIISQQQSDNNLIFQSIYQVQNTILTSDYVNINLQNKQNAVNNVKSLGQSLSTQEGLIQSIINILKNFQILCLLSNFVQLLGPLIVFKAQLPQPLYTGALLGASFIFTEIPSPDELSINSNTTSNEDIDNHKKLLQQLGFKDNIYQNLALPHLLLIISVIISLLCLFARQVIEGKQYTIRIVNFLVNIMSQLHQGYISCTLLSIYYSLEYSSQKQYAIMQLREDGEAIWC